MPQVSIIMPCYNHGRFLAQSAGAILAQTFNDLELIIIDDCSRDESVKVMKILAQSDQRVKLIFQSQNGGASKSRNHGMRAAQGDFIGFCDADDIWDPGKLAFQMELLKQEPDCDLAYCNARIIDELGNDTGRIFGNEHPVPRNGSGKLYTDLLDRNFINMQSVLMRRRCLDRVGYFDEGVKWVEDWWYWVKLSRQHDFLYSPQLLASYRVHTKSTAMTQSRGYVVNRIKVFRRIMLDNPNLEKRLRARLLYRMGSELCGLGKLNLGKKILRKAMTCGATDIRAWANSAKACFRLLQYSVR